MPEPEPGGPTPDGLLGRLFRALGRDDELPIDPDLDARDPGEPSATHRPTTTPARRGRPGTLALIALGGFGGALARYEVSTTWPARPGEFPLTTFPVNTSGAFAIGVVLTLIVERLPPNPILRPLTCVGFLGAWTTVSTFVTESAVLVEGGHTGTALAYVTATVCAGLLATTVGIALARRPSVSL